jgi:hypothetical protein
MRPYDVLHGVVEKFTPIPKAEAAALQTQAVTEYHKVKKEYEEIALHNTTETNKVAEDVNYVPQYRPVNLKHKMIRFFELWYVQYAMAILFIFLIRGIQNWLTAEPESDKDDEMDVFQEFLKFKRMNN